METNAHAERCHPVEIKFYDFTYTLCAYCFTWVVLISTGGVVQNKN